MSDGFESKPEIPLVLSRYQDILEPALRNTVSDRSSFLYDMLRYCMGWSDVAGEPCDMEKGKGVRPSLCLFTCDALGGDVQKALPAAVSLELIHNFSLIHDEIQDFDEVRHHRPTLWTVWGVPKALVAGNVMRVLAERSMSCMEFADAKLISQSSSIVSEACLQMIEGQYMDISFEGSSRITVDQYMEMISRKTGALLRSSVHLGALIGSGSDEVANLFRRVGIALGFMFQIRDDILGTWGESKATGKPVGADIKRRKNTLPIIHAREAKSGLYEKEISNLYSLKSLNDDEAERVLEILDDTKAMDYCQGLVGHYALQVHSYIESVGFSEKSDKDFKELIDFLVTRKY